MPAFLISFLYVFLLFLGTLTTSFLDVPLRLFLPNFLTFSDLIIIFLSFLSPLKAFFPIVLSFLELIVTCKIFLHPAKADAPIVFIFLPTFLTYFFDVVKILKVPPVNFFFLQRGNQTPQKLSRGGENGTAGWRPPAGEAPFFFSPAP